jgi:ketosteroid isomerase-like protein
MKRYSSLAVTLSIAIISAIMVAVVAWPNRAGASEETPVADDVRAVESAFAKTMADRDLEGFQSFLSPEVVFFSHGTVLRGPEAVSEAWASFFDDDDAPFSWAPEAVAALDSGTLAFSSGPVLDGEGNRIGTFNSVWRLDADGHWKIIFDRGCP